MAQLHEKPSAVTEEGTSKEAADKKTAAPTAAWAPPAGVPSLRGERQRGVPTELRRMVQKRQRSRRAMQDHRT